MIFSNDRRSLRKMYAEAWRKRLAGERLTPLEQQIVAVADLHPEYHGELADCDPDREYEPEEGGSNPYLHMGLHLALREQLATDRPAGISAIFAGLAARLGDRHQAEHRLIECLAETLWEAQRANRAPDEAAYLERLRKTD